MLKVIGKKNAKPAGLAQGRFLRILENCPNFPTSGAFSELMGGKKSPSLCASPHHLVGV